MAKLPKPISTRQPEPEISTEKATITSLAKDIIELKKELNEQRKESKNFILWVVGGVVVIVGIVAIEIIIFHTNIDRDSLNLQSQYFKEVKSLQENVFEMELRLQKEIDSIRVAIKQNMSDP